MSSDLIERQNDKPPMHWRPDPRYDRRPQTDEEWDWRKDAPGNNGVVFERSVNRLNFAYCHADPHAPDQMALVLRCDIGRVLGRLTRYTAHRQMLMERDTQAADENVSSRLAEEWGTLRPMITGMISDVECAVDGGGMGEGRDALSWEGACDARSAVERIDALLANRGGANG